MLRFTTSQTFSQIRAERANSQSRGARASRRRLCPHPIQVVEDRLRIGRSYGNRIPVWMKHFTLLLIVALLFGCAAMRDEDHAKPAKQIGEAFGLRLGEAFPSTNQAPATGYDPESLIPVVPPGTNANFQNYFVAVTPKSGLIWSIIAKSSVAANFATG